MENRRRREEEENSTAYSILRADRYGWRATNI